MESNAKLQIYKGMINYLLESTNYTIKDIANLLDSQINSVRAIYCEEIFPANFVSEIKLVELYRIILELNLKASRN